MRLLGHDTMVSNPTHFYSLQKDDKTNTRISSSKSRTDEPHIGKYRLIKTIGKGNFAKVKLAKHVPTGREVSGMAKITLAIIDP